MAETKKIKKVKPQPEPSSGGGKSTKAALREIELEKAKIELASLKLDLEVDQHRLKGYRDERKKKQNEDEALGIFSLETGVGTSVVNLSGAIRKWARAHEGKTITLNIFSPGGSLMHGLVLYDTLRTLSSQGHTIITSIRGYAASMGGLIALAGDVRTIGGESFVMIHNLSAGSGGSLYEMEDDLKFYKLLQSRLDSLVVSRTKISKKLLAEKTKKADWWITPQEALDLGVVHEIL